MTTTKSSDDALALATLLAQDESVTLTPRQPDFPHISYSQLNMFTRCSLQYYFRYIEGLKQRPNLAMAIGKGGHAALEQNGRTKIATKQDMVLSDLLDYAGTAIDREVSDVEDTVPKEVGTAKDSALGNLRVYHAEYAPKVTPIGVEIEFNLDLNEPNKEPIRVMNGKIDLLAEDPDITYTDPRVVRVMVEDYKWVGKRKNQLEADVTKQFDAYLLFVRTLTGKYATRARFMQMTPGNTKAAPDVVPLERDPLLLNPDAQERRFARLRSSAGAMESIIKTGAFMPTDDPIKCSWCGYRERCQSSLVNDFEARTIRSQTA